MAVLLPAGVWIASGSLRNSLWLDEILYYYLQDDLALRASEIGRPDSPFAPYFSSFFFGDLQRFAQSLVRPLGLTVTVAPEVTLRMLPVASFVGACLVFFVSLRRRTEGRADAVLATLVFSSMPLVLHYAFEARVYIFTTFLALLLVELLTRSEASPSGGRLLVLAGLGVLTAHTHLWTVCLFAALAGDAALRLIRERRMTSAVRLRLAAALPAIALVAAEWLYMKSTDPGRPQYLPFRPQPVLLTLRELVVSNFAGPMTTQYVPLSLMTGFLLVTGGSVLLAAHIASAARGEEGERRRLIIVALSALGLCVLMAVTVGYYQHGRYHLPLLAVLLLAAATHRGFLRRGLMAGLVTANLALFPDNLEEMTRKSDAKRIATWLLRQVPDRRSLGIIVQNLPTGGYPFPAHSIGLDFYLNVLHPGEPEVLVCELPGLDRVNGRRGVYDFFASDPKLFESYLESRPDTWRRRLPNLPLHLFLIHPVWGVEGSRTQLESFSDALYESSRREFGSMTYMYGFPHSILIHLPVNTSGKPAGKVVYPPAEKRTFGPWN